MLYPDTRRRLALSITLACLLCTPASSVTVQPDTAAHLKQPHRAVLQKWLARRPGLRPATATDAADKEGVAGAVLYYGKGYHPYYAVADFNHDGHEDFAVGLVSGGRQKELAVALFNGPFRVGAAARPAFFKDKLRIHDWLYVKQKSLLLVGPYETDVGFFVRPRGKGYVVKYE